MVDVGSSIAVCTSCGMGYTFEKVREMAAEHSVSPPPVKEKELPLWEEVKIEPVKIRIRTSVKSGFQCMTLYGVVESGIFDLKTDLYVDEDEQKLCRVARMTSNDMEIDIAKKEMQIVLTVYGTQVKHLKNVKYLTAPAALSGSLEEEVYFMQIITSNFKNLTVKRNVRITPQGSSVPASFVLFKNKKPVLAIILCSSRVYNMPKIENTMEACKKQGIPVQRYFTEFENDKEYVVNRIKSAL